MIALSQGKALTERLHRALVEGARWAAQHDSPLLVSVAAPVPPFDPLAVFAQARGERFLWEQPRRGFSLVGLGEAVGLEGWGEGRFSEVAAAWRGLVSSAVVDAGDGGCPLRPPVCMGGFAFDHRRQGDAWWEGYPHGLLMVPRLLFLSKGGSFWVVLSEMAGPDIDPAAAAGAMVEGLRSLGSGLRDGTVESCHAIDITQDDRTASRWRGAVAAAVGKIRGGAVEKVVLARRVPVCAPEPVDVVPVLGRLRASYGNCTIFALARGEACFLGASPERLLRLEGRSVRVDCLAGSTARGSTKAEDRALAKALLADAKERHEHALVVRALEDALAPLCRRLTLPERPRVLRMPNVQHLYTPVQGYLREGAHVLDLVARLHPTPASGGLPRDAALSLIRSYEPFDRGWYAGPVGWVDGRGGGEFVVAIRSALLRRAQALLYAGCGIVADSDPEQEYQESRLKLWPMLWALNGRKP